MPTDESGDGENRVVPLHRGTPARPPARPQRGGEDDSGLKRFEHSEDDDDYRQRMMTNGIALGFLVFLIVAGIWIANTMAAMRKSQDCVLSGRPGCTPVDVSPRPRW